MKNRRKPSSLEHEETCPSQGSGVCKRGEREKPFSLWGRISDDFEDYLLGFFLVVVAWISFCIFL